MLADLRSDAGNLLPKLLRELDQVPEAELLDAFQQMICGMQESPAIVLGQASAQRTSCLRAARRLPR
jgi:hypothetical protein